MISASGGTSPPCPDEFDSIAADDDGGILDRRAAGAVDQLSTFQHQWSCRHRVLLPRIRMPLLDNTADADWESGPAIADGSSVARSTRGRRRCNQARTSAVAASALVRWACSHCPRPRKASPTSTRARPSRLIVGGSEGGGYDTMARAIGRHHRPAHPRQSRDRRQEHARRQRDGGDQPSLQRRRQGRHRDRPPAEQQPAGAAVRQQGGALRRDASSTGSARRASRSRWSWSGTRCR